MEFDIRNNFFVLLCGFVYIDQTNTNHSIYVVTLYVHCFCNTLNVAHQDRSLLQNSVIEGVQ